MIAKLVQIVGLGLIAVACSSVAPVNSTDPPANPPPKPGSITGRLIFRGQPLRDAKVSVTIFPDIKCLDAAKKVEPSKEEQQYVDGCKVEDPATASDHDGNYTITPSRHGYCQVFIEWTPEVQVAGDSGYSALGGDFQVYYSRVQKPTKKVVFFAFTKPENYTGDNEIVKNLNFNGPFE